GCRRQATPRRPRESAETRSTSERLEPHAHALAELAVAAVGLLERELVSRPSLGELVLRHQHVALERRVLSVVGGSMRRIEQLERLVVCLLIEQHRREAKSRQVTE